MATDYFVDFQNGSDANPGTSTGTAKKSFAAGMALLAAASDRLFCNLGGATEEVATVGFTTTVNGGGPTTPFEIIGVNSSWVDDGTRYKINGNSEVAQMLTIGHTNYKYKNFEFYGFTTACIGSPSTNNFFINCIFRNSGGYGIANSTNAALAFFIKCKFYNNTSGGGSAVTGISNFYFCEFYSNSGPGYGSGSTGGGIFYFCIFRDNTGATGHGARLGSAGNRFIGCTFDGNAGSGIDISSGHALVLCCRLTNNGTRFGRQGGGRFTEDLNYYSSTTDNGSTALVDSLYGRSASAGTEGYVDRTNKDFRLTRSATNISIPEKIGSHYDGLTTAYVTAGLPRIEPTMPAISNVIYPTTYADNGTELSGTYVEPLANNMVFGTSAGNPTSAINGNVTLPIFSNVKLNTQYGTSGTQYTGTFSAPQIQMQIIQ